MCVLGGGSSMPSTLQRVNRNGFLYHSVVPSPSFSQIWLHMYFLSTPEFGCVLNAFPNNWSSQSHSRSPCDRGLLAMVHLMRHISKNSAGSFSRKGITEFWNHVRTWTEKGSSHQARVNSINRVAVEGRSIQSSTLTYSMGIIPRKVFLGLPY